MADGLVENADNLGGEGDGPEWVGKAWRLWLEGVRNYSELGRTFAKHRTTVKEALVAYSKARAAECEDGIDPTAEYVEGLETDLRENGKLYREAQQENIKLGCLKERHALRKDLAAARGVVTERKALNLGGSIAVDFAREWDAIRGNEDAAEAAFALGDALASGAADDSQLGTEADEG